jgi:hypothetical protein
MNLRDLFYYDEVYEADGVGSLIGHSLHNDVKWLEIRSAELAHKNEIPAPLNLSSIPTIAIGLVDRVVRADFQNCKLEEVGLTYGAEFKGVPHNGGNDAVITMDTFLGISKAIFGVDVG